MKIFGAELKEREFKSISSLIMDRTGIKLPPSKKTMLEGRMRKRLRKLGYDNFRDYTSYLFSNEGMRVELVNLINVVTTNKTEFFRESDHFEYLTSTILPLLSKKLKENREPLLKVWSAGCSTGEEPYTLAIVLDEFMKLNPQYRMKYSILASDIDTDVLNKARIAVYKKSSLDQIPEQLVKRYFLKSRSHESNLVKIVPELRDKLYFKQINFQHEDFGLDEPMDIIFCRNVIIYFDRPTQEKIIRKLAGNLKDDGYLFLGHSENITGMDVSLENKVPTVFRKIL